MAASLGPGDLPGIYNVLGGALSADMSTQRSAEGVLHELELRSGYCSCLAEIVAQPSADGSARWLAAVQLKNATGRLWRGRAAGTLGEEEKAHLRGRLVQLAALEDRPLAVQACVTIAKIARSDFPKAWPTLLSDLGGLLRDGVEAPPPAAAGGGAPAPPTSVPPPSLRERRGLMVLHHVLRELSAKRLASDRRAFQELALGLLPDMWGRLEAATERLLGEIAAWRAGGRAGTPAVPDAPPRSAEVAGRLAAFLEAWRLQLAITRRLLLLSRPSDAVSLEPSPEVEAAAPRLLAWLDASLALVAPATSPRPARGVPAELLGALLRLQETHPWSTARCGATVSALERCCAWAQSPPLLGSAPPGVAEGATRRDDGGGGGDPGPAHDDEDLELGDEPLASASDSDGGGEGETGPDAMRRGFLRRALAFTLAVARCPGYRGSAAAASLGRGAAAREEAVRRAAAELAPRLGAAWAAAAGPLASALVRDVFPLSPRELEAWDDDPEGFASTGGLATPAAGDTETLRGVGEALFSAIADRDPAAASAAVREALAVAERRDPPPPGGWGGVGVEPAGRPDPTPAELRRSATAKAAAYRALAVSAFTLGSRAAAAAGAPPPPSWRDPAGILAEMRDLRPETRVLRAQALALPASYASELSREDRQELYPALAEAVALGPDEPVGAAAAVSSLRALVDDWGFDPSDLAPHASEVFGALATVLARSPDVDARLPAFSLLNLCVERLGPDVLPSARGLLELLPAAWASARDQPTLRIEALVAYQRLAVPLADEPSGVAAVCAAAGSALDAVLGGAGAGAGGAGEPGGAPPDPANAALAEDALALWLVLLRCAPSPEDGRAALLAPLASRLEAFSRGGAVEHLDLTARVLESALLLGGPPLVAEQGARLAATIAAQLHGSNDRGVALLAPALDALIAAAASPGAPPALGAPAAPAAGPVLAACGALAVRTLVPAGAAGVDPRGDPLPEGTGEVAGVPPRPSALLAASAIAVLSRAALAFGAGALAEAAGRATGRGTAAAVAELQELFLSRFASLARPVARKLATLALAALAAELGGAGDPAAAVRAAASLCLASREAEALASEVGEGVLGGVGFDGRRGAAPPEPIYLGPSVEAPRGTLDDDPALAASEDAAGEARRRDAREAADPTRTVPVVPFLAAALDAARRAHGPALDAALADVPPEASSALGKAAAAARGS